jgi:class 3 adenylate cyclase
VAIFNSKDVSQHSAVLNIIKTLFVMVLLTGGAIIFNGDAQSLVIDPLERMMGLVRKLAENPLAVAKVDGPHGEAETQGKDYETRVLEQTLSKIGGLLQVGFGVAGADIIRQNMGTGGDLQVMIPGNKVTCVFGFGIIEHFTETVSCLEERICQYINEIARIVHGAVHDYYGAANKNIGVAFLVAWKICKGMLPGLKDPRDVPPAVAPTAEEEEAHAQEIDMLRKNKVSIQRGAGRRKRKITPMEMVDSAIAAFLRCQLDISRANESGFFAKYINAKVKEAFGNDFSVHMGFGMHIGWAIEGAIGSRFKVDASYLSPNVNMSARLEAATHQFGCPFLLSEWIVGECSPGARALCRLIDRVTVKGSQVPMSLYTFDISSTYNIKDALKPKFTETGEQVPLNFEQDIDILSLRRGIDPEFFVLFDSGVKAYLAGDWQKAKNDLERADRLKGDDGDGPTQCLLSYMGNRNFVAPDTWLGFRALTSK